MAACGGLEGQEAIMLGGSTPLVPHLNALRTISSKYLTRQDRIKVNGKRIKEGHWRRGSSDKGRARCAAERALRFLNTSISDNQM